MLFVLLRPQESEQAISPMKTTGTSNGEVDQEGDTLGLGQDRVEVLAGGIP
jgi:hypothetical protein